MISGFEKDVLSWMHMLYDRVLRGRADNVHSENHLDVPQTYGNKFPIVLGREFCGEVIDVSPDLMYTYPVGSKVVGYLKPHQSGALSECIHVPAYHCGPLPTNLSPLEGNVSSKPVQFF